MADQRYWMLRASRHAQVSVADARHNIEDALSYAITFSRRKSAWEVGEPKMRVIQIGCELCLPSSEKFRAKNPEALEWLATQDCDEQEAVRRFRDFMVEEGKHPFWRRKVEKRKVVSRKVVFRTNAGQLHDHDRDGGTSSTGASDDTGASTEPRTGPE